MDKNKDFSEWYTWVLKEAELVDIRYNVKGFPVIRPWAFSVMKRIYSAYEDELDRNGHSPMQFPAVIPESNLNKEKEHIKGFEDAVFWIEKAGMNRLEERLALRPTSETAIYPMYALWINGISDLPLKLYQSGTVWRYETKATRPLIRVREIQWIETHCCFATKEGAEAQIIEDKAIAETVIGDALGIPFLFFQRPKWDKFPGADDTYAADSLMPDGKVLQIATTHMLGQNFSKPFEVKFSDSDGKEKYVWQTCYGPGMSRIFAALISHYGDDKGIIYHYFISPIQAVIVPIYKGENKAKIDNYAQGIMRTLKENNIRAYYDNSNNTPGFKYNRWELKGIPIRIEVGEREIDANKVVIVYRDAREKKTTELETVANDVSQAGKEMFERMKNNVFEKMRNSIDKSEDMDDIGKKLDLGRIIKIPFCSMEMEGEPCYEQIKEKLKAEVRGTLFGSEEKPKGKKCAICGKEAHEYAYVARQY